MLKIDTPDGFIRTKQLIKNVFEEISKKKTQWDVAVPIG